MDETILRAAGLNLWYGENHALKDINIDIPRNQTLMSNCSNQRSISSIILNAMLLTKTIKCEKSLY